jgi:hypothetical protein
MHAQRCSPGRRRSLHRNRITQLTVAAVRLQHYRRHEAGQAPSSGGRSFAHNSSRRIHVMRLMQLTHRRVVDTLHQRFGS